MGRKIIKRICPFCKNDNSVCIDKIQWDSYCYRGDKGYIWAGYCTNCGFSMPTTKTRKASIELWDMIAPILIEKEYKEVEV